MANNPELRVTNMKIVIKIPEKVYLEEVVQRCRRRRAQGFNVTRYPSFIVIGQLPNPLPPKTKDTWNARCKLILFKYRSTIRRKTRHNIVEFPRYKQTLNVVGIKKEEHIGPILELISKLIQVEKSLLTVRIDCMNAVATLPTPVIKSQFVKANPKESFHQLEVFPSIKLHSLTGVTCLLFASGKIIMCGATAKYQLQEALHYVKTCFARYQHLELQEALITQNIL